MPELNLSFLIFLCVFLTQLVAWIGKSVLQELAFSAYSRIFLSGTARKQRALRKQILEDKAELSRTSSQDEFAKWAKLKRKVDKQLADLEKLNGDLGSAKSSFCFRFSSLLWVLTTGVQLVLVWWYRKQPVFWLPQGWVPAPVAWVLSLPSAPKGEFHIRPHLTGSVSSGAWCAVCKRVLATGEEIVKDLLTPTAAEAGPAPVGMPSAASRRPESRTEELEHEKVD